MIQFIQKKKKYKNFLYGCAIPDCDCLNIIPYIRLPHISLFHPLPRAFCSSSLILTFLTFIYIHLPFMMASTSNDVPFDNTHTHVSNLKWFNALFPLKFIVCTIIIVSVCCSSNSSDSSIFRGEMKNALCNEHLDRKTPY